MKKYKIRKGSIADKAVRFADTLDRQPWCYIAFAVFMGGFVAAMMLAYNGVVPAYQ